MDLDNFIKTKDDASYGIIGGEDIKEATVKMTEKILSERYFFN